MPIWESQVSQQLYDMENDWVRHCPFSLAHACLSTSLKLIVPCAARDYEPRDELCKRNHHGNDGNPARAAEGGSPRGGMSTASTWHRYGRAVSEVMTHVSWNAPMVHANLRRHCRANIASSGRPSLRSISVCAFATARCELATSALTALPIARPNTSKEALASRRSATQSSTARSSRSESSLAACSACSRRVRPATYLLRREEVCGGLRLS